MFPGVDGFHWTVGHIFFIFGVFAIVSAIAGIVIVTLARVRRDLATGRTEPIRWSADFADLPASDRWCRHALTGEAPGRICPNAFDCRNCVNHPKFGQARRGDGPDIICGLKYPNHRYYQPAGDTCCAATRRHAPDRSRRDC